MIAPEHLDRGVGEVVGDFGTDERAAAADAFRIDVRFLVGMARVLECADNTAGGRTPRRADAGSSGGREQPACGNDRAEARDREQAEPGEQAARAADERAGRRAAADVAVGIGLADRLSGIVARVPPRG